MVAAFKRSEWYISQTWEAHGVKWSFTYYEISARRVIESGVPFGDCVAARSISLNIPCSDMIRHASPQAWLEKWASTKAGKAQLGKLQQDTTHQLNFLRGKVEESHSEISPKKKNIDKCSPCLTYSQELEGQPSQETDSELKQLNLLKSIQTHNSSCDRTTETSLFTQISETTIQNEENSTSLVAVFPVQEQVPQERKKDCLIPIHRSGNTDLESVPPLDPSSLSPSNLLALSEEVLEQYLADSEWSAIQANLASLERQSLGRVTKDPDCLSFPTLTSGDKSMNSRPPGMTKCEKWFKDRGYTPHGSQLSAQAMSKMMGFPEDYLNPLSPYLPATQDESKPDTSQGEPLHPDKQRSPSAESFISIPSNSFLGESDSPIFLGENSGQDDRTLQISPKKKTDDPNPSEIFLGENDQPQAMKQISPKKNPSGSLYPFIQDKKDKYGNVKTYPKVVGDRDPDNPDHWFWAYCWDEKVNGKWKTFKRSVAREKLEDVRRAIISNQPVSEILKIIS